MGRFRVWDGGRRDRVPAGALLLNVFVGFVMGSKRVLKDLLRVK